MRILFDQGTPLPLRRLLAGHEVTTAYEKSWDKLTNGDLLKAAEAEFDLLITTDQNLGYQQNLSGRKLAIHVLPTTRRRSICRQVQTVVAAVNQATPSEYRKISWPS